MVYTEVEILEACDLVFIRYGVKNMLNEIDKKELRIHIVEEMRRKHT